VLEQKTYSRLGKRPFRSRCFQQFLQHSPEVDTLHHSFTQSGRLSSTELHAAYTIGVSHDRDLNCSLFAAVIRLPASSAGRRYHTSVSANSTVVYSAIHWYSLLIGHASSPIRRHTTHYHQNRILILLGCQLPLPLKERLHQNAQQTLMV